MRDNTQFSFIERIMLQHAHPLKLTCDCLGIIIGIYFLWIHNLMLAIIFIIGLSILGNILVWKTDIEYLSTTNLGKWMLGQAQPINLVLRVIGALILSYGFWEHSVVYIISGVLVIILARFLGTKRIAKN